LDLGALTAGAVTGLREGVEAALVVAIVLAYLNRTGHRDGMIQVWVGTGLAAVVALVAGAVIFVTVGGMEAPYEQYFEAATLLVAAAVVTWMLFWMRRESMAIRGELHAAIDRAVTEGATLGLAVLAFSAVIREGLETSIFLVAQVTSAGAGGGSVLVGALIGLAAAVAIGWLFYTGSRRVDLRSFFRWTGIGLIFIAAGLLARAVHELVEVGAIAFGSQPAYDITSVFSDATGLGQFLRAILGYSSAPEVTTLVVHLAYLVAVLVLYLRPVRRATPPAPRVEVPKASETAAP
jgi:high-affinity iron transporter